MEDETPEDLVNRLFKNENGDPTKVIQALYWITSPKGYENYEQGKDKQ
jgi:hypothetical protein